MSNEESPARGLMGSLSETAALVGCSGYILPDAFVGTWVVMRKACCKNVLEVRWMSNSIGGGARSFHDVTSGAIWTLI